MNMRSSRSTVTFPNAFALSGYPGELPSGDYEVVVEEELLQGLSFEAWLRTATYLLVQGQVGRSGRTEMRRTTDNELKLALGRDGALSEQSNIGKAAAEPQEDLK